MYNGTATQLHLSDLKADCPTVTAIPAHNHNIYDKHDPGCNPVLSWPLDLKLVK
jgi:hypothetical protein